jgi:dephospho-CoA kinase
MFRVGLTGGIASGKTSVCRIFSELGIEIFDADDIARELVHIGTPCYQQIVQQFGTDFLLADRTLDRRKLRTHIFSDAQAKVTLENILHPAIHTTLISKSADSQSPYCILAIPLLAESLQPYPLNRIILVDTLETLQLQRLCIRDKVSPKMAHAMLSQQSSRADKLAIANDILRNDTDLDQLKEQVLSLHERYLQLAKQT